MRSAGALTLACVAATAAALLFTTSPTRPDAVRPPSKQTAPSATEAVVAATDTDVWVSTMHEGVSMSFEREQVAGDVREPQTFDVQTLGPLSAAGMRDAQAWLDLLSRDADQRLAKLAASTEALTPRQQVAEAKQLRRLARYEAMRTELLAGNYWTVENGQGSRQMALDLPGYSVAVAPVQEQGESREVVVLLSHETHPRLVESVAYLHEMQDIERICAAASFNALDYETRSSLIAQRKNASRSRDPQALQGLLAQMPLGITFDQNMMMLP